MSELTDAFQDVQGVGPKKAHELAEIAEEHQDDGISMAELERVRDALRRRSVGVALGRLNTALNDE
jgi:hypothetical protein